MANIVSGRPADSELAPHAIAYSNLVLGDDALHVLQRQVGETILLMKSFSEERASEFRYAPGKWTVKEQIQHLSDSERILSCRALRIARADNARQSPFEQDDYVREAEANRRSLADLADELYAVRQSTITLFRGFSPDVLLRRGQVSEWSLTVRGVMFTIAGHELHHFQILKANYC